MLQVCFIKTTNLDGESNLKIRRPVDLKENAPDNVKEVFHMLYNSCCVAHIADIAHVAETGTHTATLI